MSLIGIGLPCPNIAASSFSSVNADAIIIVALLTEAGKSASVGDLWGMDYLIKGVIGTTN